MRLIIQRVSSASVTINNNIHSVISKGLMILLGIGNDDTLEDIEWLCTKISNLRIFSDSDNKMNLSIQDINGEILLVSQFTLFASTQKGNRPSYIKAAPPEKAIPLYEAFIATLSSKMNKKIKTGVFGADMQVALVNDGPVTIIMDSKNKE